MSNRLAYIHQRFDRDFLPRYGNVWRHMVETSSQGLTFLDAIRNTTTIHLQVHPCIDGERNCLGCSPPIVDVDHSSDQENQSLVEKVPRDATVTSSSSFIHSNSEDGSDHDDSSTRNTPSTPLPSSLQEEFGRILTFGNDEEHDAWTKGMPRLQTTATTLTVPSQHLGDLVTKPFLNAPLNASEYGLSQPESGGVDNETDSSRSSIIRFDVSHVLNTSPAKDHGQQTLSVENVVPEFSPGEGGCVGEIQIEGSVVRYCDLSDYCIASDRRGEDLISSDSPHQSKTHNHAIVIDLVDTDDENFSPVTLSRHGREVERGDLEDTSAESASFQKLMLPTQHIRSNAQDIDESVMNRFWVGRSNSKVSYRHFEEPSVVAFHIARNPDQPLRKHATCGKRASFKKNRAELSACYFQEFNTIAFEGKLACVKVEWSNKLRTTAGLTRLQKRQQDFSPGVKPSRFATIELSSKVLDDTERLRSTLLHEMVHAAAWIIDGVSKPAHGQCFRKWAAIAMSRVPSIKVTTTHDYQIQYKYAWACTRPDCGFLVQRHSRSVDVERQCCGRCRGRLMEVEVPHRSSRPAVELHKTLPRRGTRTASGYNFFVKEQSKMVRDKLVEQGQLNVSQAEIMKECAKLWQVQKKQVTEPV